LNWGATTHSINPGGVIYLLSSMGYSTISIGTVDPEVGDSIKVGNNCLCDYLSGEQYKEPIKNFIDKKLSEETLVGIGTTSRGIFEMLKERGEFTRTEGDSVAKYRINESDRTIHAFI